MRITKKYISKRGSFKTVYRLLDFQQHIPDVVNLLKKKIKVYHFHKKYQYNFFIYLKDKSKGFHIRNRVILYDVNFLKKWK